MSKEDKAEFNEAIKTAGRDYTQNQKNSQLEYVTAVQNAQQKFQEKAKDSWNPARSSFVVSIVNWFCCEMLLEPNDYYFLFHFVIILNYQ